MAIPGGGPGRTESLRGGGAGGGTDRSARAGGSAAAGWRAAGSGVRGAASARVRSTGFAGSLPFDFAEECDATVFPRVRGTVRAAELVRAGRAMGYGVATERGPLPLGAIRRQRSPRKARY